MVWHEVQMPREREQRTNRELIEHNAIFFLKAFDHRLLGLTAPACDGEQEDLKVRRHGNK